MILDFTNTEMAIELPGRQRRSTESLIVPKYTSVFNGYKLYTTLINLNVYHSVEQSNSESVELKITLSESQSHQSDGDEK